VGYELTNGDVKIKDLMMWKSGEFLEVVFRFFERNFKMDNVKNRIFKGTKRIYSSN
jgi:hypothetical protein